MYNEHVHSKVSTKRTSAYYGPWVGIYICTSKTENIINVDVQKSIESLSDFYEYAGKMRVVIQMR